MAATVESLGVKIPSPGFGSERTAPPSTHGGALIVSEVDCAPANAIVVEAPVIIVAQTMIEM